MEISIDVQWRLDILSSSKILAKEKAWRVSWQNGIMTVKS